MSSLSLFFLATLMIISMHIIAVTTQPLTISTTLNTTKPGCPSKCGNLTVPYPFGIGMDSGCSIDTWFDILCATSFDPPKAFLPSMLAPNQTMVQILDISDTQIKISNHFVAHTCYNSSGGKTSGVWDDDARLDYVGSTGGAPFRLSASANRLIVVGCNDQATLSLGAEEIIGNKASSSCPTNCSTPDTVDLGSCLGHGCCQATIPSGPNRYFSLWMNYATPDNHTYISSWNPCGYAFVGEEGTFNFRGVRDLNQSDINFMDQVKNEVPVVMDWVAQDTITCKQAKQNMSSYLCQQPHTLCEDADPVLGGYRCRCEDGYEGNPYLSPGCTDANECDWKINNCTMGCVNTLGSYKCQCPSGYSGDGRKDGTGCEKRFPIASVALGASFSLLLLTLGGSWMFLTIKQKRRMRRRNQFFQQNGGFLLKQLLPSNHEQSTKIFSVRELMIATNNFSEASILGTGGYGTVYRGVLPGNQEVAIKRSKIVDESQIEQFINEVIILTRINHPYVVKLLGCCLESEVPLLVYEFISNGTLYDRIHDKNNVSSLSWSRCLRIASESAEALAYLHSVPIFHRDIKSMNILLDDNLTAKISDFGISRLIPMDKTRLATLVQGTLGYLDPEYFFSSELTSKSDVYSYGVVLAELLTRQGPLLDERETNEKNLSMYFVKCMRAGELIEIVDPQLVKEASEEQLMVVGEIIQSCLSVKADDRPTMKEVALVLQDLCKSQQQ